MSDIKTAIATLLICSCLALIFVCSLALQKRPTSGAAAVFLSLSGLCAVVYDFGYAMEIFAVTLPDVLFWVRFEHWGIQFLPVFWLMFSLSIMNKKKLVRFLPGLLLLLPPLVAFLCSQTLGGLNLLHPNPRLASGEVITRFTYDRGWTIYLVTAVQNVYIAGSVILLTAGLVRGTPLPRKQTVIYWLGSVFPWASSLAFNFGKLPFNIDATPLVLSLSVTLLMVGFLGIGILEENL